MMCFVASSNECVDAAQELKDATAQCEAALLDCNLQRQALQSELAKTASHPRSGDGRRRKVEAEEQLAELDSVASGLRLQIRRLGN
jgi:hypothetical protein